MNTTLKRTALTRLAMATALAAALTGGALAGPSAAFGDTAHRGTGEGRTGRLTQSQLQREVEQAMKGTGYVSVSAEVRDGKRRLHATTGEAELGTGRQVPRGSAFRAASITKSFVATVVMQLVAEGRLTLDDTVEKWLPGVVKGNGNDGSRITVRNLLQHTSGVHSYDYTEDVGESAEDFERTRFDHWDARQDVDGAMRHAPSFPPASADDPKPDWEYSNTGYVLLGMIIHKVTGSPWADQVRDRIIRPLGLTHTYEPGDDPYLKGPHAHTYHQFPGSDHFTDTTDRNVSWADSAGSLVSDDRDLDRFYTALLGGELLPKKQLDQMRTTVPVSDDFQEVMPGLRYGLGLMRQPLECGGVRWGHGGDLDGATVRTGFTEDGEKSVVITTTGKTSDDETLFRAERAVQKLTDQALCGGKG